MLKRIADIKLSLTRLNGEYARLINRGVVFDDLLEQITLKNLSFNDAKKQIDKFLSQYSKAIDLANRLLFIAEKEKSVSKEHEDLKKALEQVPLLLQKDPNKIKDELMLDVLQVLQAKGLIQPDPNPKTFKEVEEDVFKLLPDQDFFGDNINAPPLPPEVDDLFAKPLVKIKDVKDKGKQPENPLRAKRNAYQKNEVMPVFLREDLLNNAIVGSQNIYINGVIQNQYFEAGAGNNTNQFRKAAERDLLINGKLRFGFDKTEFQRLTDHQLAVHIVNALGVDQQTAMHIMQAHTQGMGALVAMSIPFSNAAMSLGPQYAFKTGFGKYSSINIIKDEKNNVRAECHFDGFPLADLEGKVVGYTGAVKSVFQLAQKNGDWGYELEYIATDDSFVHDALIGKMFTENELLQKVSLSTPSHYLDVVNQALIETGLPAANVSNAPVMTELDTIAALNPIVSEMRKLEAGKYPISSFSYVSSVLDNGMNVSYVKHSGNELSHQELKSVKQNTLALRKLSLIAGVIYMFEKSDRFMTADPNLRQNIIKVLNDKAIKIANGESKQSYNDFVDHLVVKIGKELPPSQTKIKNVMRCMRNAERYFVAEYNQNRLLVNETKNNNNHVFQVDVPFGNKLTDTQKQEYVRIHSKTDKPIWFTELSGWEQDWFLNKVPKNVSDNWQAFERLYISSTMQQVPGIKNGRYNYLFKKENEKVTKLSNSFKMSTMVPYEMPKMEKQRIIEMNAEQTLSNIVKDPSKPVLAHSLLSDIKVGGTIDVSITKAQVNGVAKVASAYNLNVISGNDPINIARLLVPVTSEPKHLGRWSHIDKLLQFYDKNQSQFGTLAHEAAKNLKELRDKNILVSLLSRRNYMSHKAAYASILTEAMGGVVSTNCKSGKDRTGLDQINRAAMLIYFERHNQLPKFDDNQVNRNEYLDIYKTLFNSMAVQESAALNTPGSFGIIDNARVLCGDIKDTLKTIYHEAIELGNFNKSPGQRRDELIADKERKARDKELAKQMSNPKKADVELKPQLKLSANQPAKLDPNGLVYYGHDADITVDKAAAEAAMNQKLNLPINDPSLGGLAARTTKGVTSKLTNNQARWITYDVLDHKNNVTIPTGMVQSVDSKSCKEDLYGDLNKFKDVPRKKASFSIFSGADIPGMPVIQWAAAAIENFEQINVAHKTIYITQGSMPNVCVEALILVAKVLDKDFRHDSKIKVNPQQVEFLRTNWDKWFTKNKAIISDIPEIEVKRRHPGQDYGN